MRLALAILLLSVAVLAPVHAHADTETAIQHYIAGTQARQNGDYDLYASSMEKAVAELPGHSILYRHIAQAHALAGRNEKALGALHLLAATGGYFDLSDIEDFAGLIEHAGYEAAIAAIDENHKPLGEASVHATLPDPLLVPEGIAFDAQSDALYLSSLRGRKIIRVNDEGAVDDFAGDLETYYAGLGLEVDGKRNMIWAVSASFAGMLGHEESNDGWTSLCAFDLATGERVREFVVPAEGETGHNFNDLTLDSAGRVYITDAVSGALYSLAPGAEELELFLPEGSLSGPNGIALDETNDLLYVAQYSLDIVAVDLDTKQIHMLERAENIATFGVDGLYHREGELIAVQNHPALDRIARFVLDEDGLKIESMEVLARRLEHFEEPTTGAICGDEFVFIANSQIETYSAMEPPVEASDLKPVVLLKVKL